MAISLPGDRYIDILVQSRQPEGLPLQSGWRIVETACQASSLYTRSGVFSRAAAEARASTGPPPQES